MVISFLGIVGVTLFGSALVQLFLKAIDWREKVALGYIIGLGSYSFLLFVFNILGIKYSLINSYLILVLMISVTFFVNLNVMRNYKHIHIFDSLSLKLTKKEISLLLLTSLLMLTTLIMGIYWPVRDWDALTLYDFRGRVYAQNGWTFKVFDNFDAPTRIYYLVYPLMTSVIHGWIYLSSGNPPVIYSLYYISFVTVFYFLLRRIASRTFALFFSFILASYPIIYYHAQMSYTNLPYTIYLTLGFLYLYFWIDSKKWGYFFVSAFLVGLSTWVRGDEPFWILAIIFAFIYTLYFRKHFYISFYIPIILVIKYAWVYIRRMHLPDVPMANSTVVNSSIPFVTYLERFNDVIQYTNTYVFSPFMLLFLIFILSLYYAGKKITAASVYINSLTIMLFLTIFFGTYYTSFVYSKWLLVGGSVTRLSMLFVPIILFAVATSIYPFLPNKLRNNKHE